jgi:hypothetical protein
MSPFYNYNLDLPEYYTLKYRNIPLKIPWQAKSDIV